MRPRPILRIALLTGLLLLAGVGAGSRAAAQEDSGAPVTESPEPQGEGAAAPSSDSSDAATDEESEESGPAAAPQEDVEVLLVTATKREESIQEVPVSVAALDSGFLADSGTTEFSQIQQYVPNLVINPVTDTRGTTIRIRGIGSTGTNSGIDPSVGVFIDGVYQGRAGMSVADLLDVERVEVLRGPQGTLYGKNTAAGAINVISRRPNYEWQADLEGVFGNYSNYETRASVNIPIVDQRIASRLSGYWVTRDGFDTRLNVDRDDPEIVVNEGDTNLTPKQLQPWFEDGRVNDANKWGVKGRFLFDVTDALSFLVTGDYSYEDTKCCVADIITFEGFPTLDNNLNFTRQPPVPPGPGLPTPLRAGGRRPTGTGIRLPPSGAFDNVLSADVDPGNKIEIGGVAVDAMWDLGDVPLIADSSLNLIGAWRTYSSDSIFDGDFSYYNAVKAFTETSLNQYSAELRLVSPSGGFVEYQLGFYFFHMSHDTLDRNGFQGDWTNLFTIFPPTVNFNDNTHETFSYAGFGQASLNLSDKWSLTGGLRVTYEEKTRVGSNRSSTKGIDIPPIIGPDINKDEERDVTNLSGKISLRYFATEDAMIYGSFSSGFKSGGFNQLRTKEGVEGEFDDEESLNFEIGTRTSWFDQRLTLNGTVFYTDYDQFQAQTFDGISIDVRNAGSLRSYGIEAELALEPADGLIFGSAIGWNVAEYTDFKQGEMTAEQRYFAALPGSPASCSGSDCVQDLTGEVLDNAPHWSVNAFGQYDFPLPSIPVNLFIRGEYTYTSGRYLAQDLDRNLFQPGTHVVNLRGGFKSDWQARQIGLSGWELIGWVRNLTDEGYNVIGFDVPTLNGFAGVNAPPRQYGVTVRLHF
jgi:iron complex outermembrane receptor protein